MVYGSMTALLPEVDNDIEFQRSMMLVDEALQRCRSAMTLPVKMPPSPLPPPMIVELELQRAVRLFKSRSKVAGRNDITCVDAHVVPRIDAISLSSKELWF